MLYLYDNAICDDLRDSLSSDDSCVSIVSPENVLGVAAQLQNDEIKFPIICVTRDEDTSMDQDRWNFARAHRGFPTVLDTETNNLYYERAIPIHLSYTLCVYATNQADQDEILRELMFKYLSMYFLTIRLPYEDRRKVRFGIRIDPDMDIDKKSGSSEYLEGGTLYEGDIHLKIDGAMQYNYVPVRLKSFSHELGIEDK